jgi:hypothetical protein
MHGNLALSVSCITGNIFPPCPGNGVPFPQVDRTGRVRAVAELQTPGQLLGDVPMFEFLPFVEPQMSLCHRDQSLKDSILWYR